MIITITFMPWIRFIPIGRVAAIPGVYRLRAMDAAIGRKFLTAMTIHDEIAVILPPIGEALPTLILDCAAKAFSAVEVAQVRRLFPVLAPLHRRHISIFVTAGIDDISSPIG